MSCLLNIQGLRKEFELPVLNFLKTPTNSEDAFKNLLHTLKYGTEEEFLHNYNSCKLPKSNESQIKLLIEATKHKQKNIAFDTILLNVTDINYTINDGSDYVSVIQTACIEGNWYVLEKLLNHQDIRLRPMENLLKIIIQNLIEDQPCFWKCFDLLLESDKININELDRSGESPLDHALWHENHLGIHKLLKAGAYIGSSNGNNEYIIDGMGPQLLEELFDSCVTSNEYKPNEQNYEIYFNYKNLQPHRTLEGAVCNFREMAPIKRLLNSKAFIHLLKHPLITSFMTLKWQRIAMLFYINFILYCFFGASMVAYIVLKCEGFDSRHPKIISLAYWCTIFGIGYLIFREITQLLTPKLYLSTPSNYLEILLIYSSIKTIIMDFSTEEKPFVVIMILLMAMEFCLLVGSLPILSISTHMLMLEEVLTSFLKSFGLYSIFVFTFGLCFYVLFGKHSIDDSNGENLDMFSNLLTSFVKVMAMFVGELDLSGLDLRTVYSYMLFLLFVVFMTVVLLNLLNGLAVSDTQAIREQAELNELICRAKLLITYEHYSLPHFLHKNGDETLFNVFSQCGCKSSMCILPNGQPPNQVFYPIDCEKCCENDDSNSIRFGCGENLQQLWDCWQRKSTIMASDIVKAAMEITANKNLENKDKNRLQNIEKNVEKMFKMLEKITTTIN